MPTAVLIWVWSCAYLSCVGWTLSALHQLNAAGYTVALLAGIAVLLVWRKKTSGQLFPRLGRSRLCRRFRRPFPAAFLMLALLAFLGGAGHAPSNYDALAYRLPRVLHWLAHGQWHWIPSIFPRINTRSTGIEWMSAPVIALLKTDRWLFLINFASLLLLPGLVFSVFTRLGVRRRVAWHWMWLAPTGYCFLLQAGSIGNDLFGAPLTLAAVDFALRAGSSRSPRDFFASLLAAALLTNAKTSNLPLLLPWALALLPSLSVGLRRPLWTAAVCLAALASSVVPNSIFNQWYCGDWSGRRLEAEVEKESPLFLAGVNAVLIPWQNLSPPAFPFARQWHDGLQQRMPPALAGQLDQRMETGARCFDLPELQVEESAGLGFGISALLAASVAAAGWRRKKKTAVPRAVAGPTWRGIVRWSPVVSLLVLMTQSNLVAISREITPYYCLLLPLFLTGAGHERLVRRRWWRRLAGVVFVLAALLLIVSPARPLFPVRTILNNLQAQAPDSRLVTRMRAVYSVYEARNDVLAPVRDALPPDLKILGLITYDDPETSLWRPFGSRRIEHMLPEDSAADLKRRGIEYIFVKRDLFGSWFATPFDDWLKQMNARVVQKIPLNLRVSSGPVDWYLVKLQ